MSERKKNTAAKSLDGLLTQIRACRLCAEDPLKGKPLPHEPRPVIRAAKSARICVAGQAPGTRVHATGIPFNDPSGDRLREWMGVDRDTFYDESRIAIVPMGFCFPGLDDKGGDLPPRKECAPAWRAQVFEHLPNLELVLLIGQYAQTWHLGKARKKSMTDTVLHWRDYGPTYLPLPHPSWRNNVWLKKNLWFEEEVFPHLRGEVARLLR
ncbi:uracil-DNA glycosylase family protein [Tepidicaulis sp.]|uniref:uracil-DNA glycosylase family protein n=1 Tax=Tepidicaulis sp. TaxID=1920809 RepID=UPI003B5BD322